MTKKKQLPPYLKNLSDVKRIKVYNSDIVLERESTSKRTKGQRDSKRGKVKAFSMKSWKRLAFIASNTSIEFSTMITLTYPKEYPLDGRESKKHLNSFMSVLRKAEGKHSYLWFMEFQKRGAVHYHILTTLMYIDHFWIANKWFDIVDSGDVMHLSAGTRVERIRKQNGGKHYAVWYSHKLRQKRLPDNAKDFGRWWGHSRDVKPEIQAEYTVFGLDSVLDSIGDWEYKENVRGSIVSVLFNASKYIENE